MSTWSGIEELYTVAQTRSFTQAALRLRAVCLPGQP